MLRTGEAHRVNLHKDNDCVLSSDSLVGVGRVKETYQDEGAADACAASNHSFLPRHAIHERLSWGLRQLKRNGMTRKKNVLLTVKAHVVPSNTRPVTAEAMNAELSGSSPAWANNRGASVDKDKYQP